MSIEIEQIKIADRMIDRIKDEEGVYWYPLSSFFLKILFKKKVTAIYRDSDLSRYMKVIDFEPFNSNGSRKTWCMNEKGIKFILKRITIGNGKNEELNELRRKNLCEACLYFGIDRTQELAPEYIRTAPILKDYDIWSLTCINNDKNLEIFSKWKRCTECNYYYPANENFYEIYRKSKCHGKCLQCEGKDFKCDNEILQFIYDHDGLDLIYAMYAFDNERIASELDIFINKGRYTDYDNKCS